MHSTLSSDSNVGRSSLREKPEAEVETWIALPKASYTVLKDKQIRDLLAAHDLSTAGDRSQLISRHERLALFAFPASRTSQCSRWVALYNANLDRSPALRKRPAELRLDMRRWEEDRRGSRKDPLKIDLTEYRVRVSLICALAVLKHDLTLCPACEQGRIR
jgi:hypothetical protein